MSQLCSDQGFNGFSDVPLRTPDFHPARVSEGRGARERLDRLFGRLREVLELIESVQADIEAGATADSPAGCWADDEFSYIEADLPATGPSLVDVSVFEGRLLIRASALDNHGRDERRVTPHARSAEQLTGPGSRPLRGVDRRRQAVRSHRAARQPKPSNVARRSVGVVILHDDPEP
jgi:hypothetical protein